MFDRNKYFLIEINQFFSTKKNDTYFLVKQMGIIDEKR